MVAKAPGMKLYRDNFEGEERDAFDTVWDRVASDQTLSKYSTYFPNPKLAGGKFTFRAVNDARKGAYIVAKAV